MDGWTPLCIACADACLPLTFKLLELDADPNVITRDNDTPVALAQRRRDDDTEEQREARGIIANMLQSYGGQSSWRGALASSKKPKPKLSPEPSSVVAAEDGTEIVKQTVSKGYTRFAG